MFQDLKLKVLLAGMIACGAIASSTRAEEVFDPSPNPFIPVPLHKEGYGTQIRHTLHKFRTTYDDYFKIWEKPREGHDLTTLPKILSKPDFYLSRKVEFDLYINRRGNFFRPFTTSFHRDHFVNFNGWPHGTEIWNPEKRESEIYPFLYIDQRNTTLINKIDKLDPFTSIHVWGKVENVSEGFPWIEITDFESIKEDYLTLPKLRSLEVGYRKMMDRDYSIAASRFEAAMTMELPWVASKKISENLASCYMQTHRFNTAREVLIQGLELYRDKKTQLVEAVLKETETAPKLLMLGQSDIKLDLLSEAKQSLELCIKLEPHNAVAHAELGLVYARMGNFAQGFWEVNAAQRLVPDGRLPEAYRNRGQIYLLLNNLEKARFELEKAVQLRPNDYMFHIELGEVFLKLNNLADAQREFESAAHADSSRPQPLFKLASLLKLQGDVAKKDGKNDDATKLYTQALDYVTKCEEKDPQFAPAYGLHAEILRALGKNDDAWKIMEKGAQMNPRSVSMLETLYEQAYTVGDWKGMEEARRREAELQPQNIDVNVRLGDVLSNKPSPDYASAESAYLKATQIDPSNAYAWARLTAMQRQQNKVLTGYQTGEKAVLIDTKNAALWSDVSELRRLNGHPEAGLAAAEASIAISDSSPARIAAAKALLDRGLPGDADVAVTHARQAVSLALTENEKTLGHGVLGASLAAAGKSEEAKAELSLANSALSNDALHNYSMGKVSLDPAEATSHYQKALELSVGDATGAKSSELMKDKAEKALREVAKASHKKEESKPKDEVVKTPEKPANEDNPLVIRIPGPTTDNQPTPTSTQPAPKNDGPKIEVEPIAEPVNIGDEPKKK